ncbi:hypothetical protein [Bradyrhizobium sp. WD16]|uniref:hypothetical protein n=1 Tax=Bradyrhizobium sp. WD16 TaxID=1521768 RepID=UPI0020A590F5|nr:hypothetical protein [Bradyrhizobium sp. WD16]
MRYESDGDRASDNEIGPGDRVRMSPQGLARHPKYGDRQGVVVARGALPSSLRVKFDERKSIQALHRNYLEKIDVPARSATRPERPVFARSALSPSRPEGADR